MSNYLSIQKSENPLYSHKNCLSVVNLDLNYLRTSRTEWAEKNFRTSLASRCYQKKFICRVSGQQGQGRGPKQKHFDPLSQLFDMGSSWNFKNRLYLAKEKNLPPLNFIFIVDIAGFRIFRWKVVEHSIIFGLSAFSFRFGVEHSKYYRIDTPSKLQLFYLQSIKEKLPTPLAPAHNNLSTFLTHF